jgi:LCP family protein required for cell wall assembly
MPADEPADPVPADPTPVGTAEPTPVGTAEPAEPPPAEPPPTAESRPVPGRGVGPTWLSIVAGAIVPGLGHLLLGRRRRAALLFLPLVVLAAAIGLVVAASPDQVGLVGEVLSPDVLLAIVVVIGGVAIYRLVVLALTVRLAARVRPTDRVGRLGRTFLATLLAIFVIAPHVIVGATIEDTRDTIIAVFQPSDLGDGSQPGSSPGLGGDVLPPLESDELDEPSPTPTVSPDEPSVPVTAGAGPTPTGTPRPTPTPGPAWADNGRLDLLLIGADAGPDRWSLRTDTMILLSVDVATGRAAMFGFPRNMTGAPLPRESAGAVPGGRYPGLLNSIYVYANGHPSQFPGGRNRGFRAIGGTIQKLTGVQLDGIAVVNLNGFVRLVDAVGGVTITIPKALHDDRYPLENGTGVIAIDFKAGRQHLDGHRALMYARSRHQDSDYGRMRRQQAVLLALRARLKPCRLISRIPSLLKIARDDAWTSLSVKDLPSLMSLATRVDAKRVRSLMFAPPTYGEAITDNEIRQIRKVVRGIFPTKETAPDVTLPPVLAPDPEDPTPEPSEEADPCA